MAVGREPGCAVPVGFSWRWTEAGWERQVMRQDLASRQCSFEAVHYVDVSYPFCHSCLAQEFDVEGNAPDLTLRCKVCGAGTRFLEEP